jgi:hypothetical protein
MNGPSDRWTEADKIAVAATNILNETGAIIHAMFYRADALIFDGHGLQDRLSLVRGRIEDRIIGRLDY